jgi:acetyltransferase-like isoleucine patch superfamily enzyme
MKTIVINALKNLKHFGRRVYAVVFCPAFKLPHGRLHAPEIEPHCHFFKPSRITIGKNVKLHRGSMIISGTNDRVELGDLSALGRYAILQSAGGFISIGQDTTIGDFCNLYGQGGLEIGSNVMIASGCRLTPHQHTFSSRKLTINKQPGESLGIQIGDGCWIGANVVVLDGVKIGLGAIIGSGAVVAQSVPAYEIWAGVPAQKIGERPL